MARGGVGAGRRPPAGRATLGRAWRKRLPKSRGRWSPRDRTSSVPPPRARLCPCIPSGNRGSPGGRPYTRTPLSARLAFRRRRLPGTRSSRHPVLRSRKLPCFSLYTVGSHGKISGILGEEQADLGVRAPQYGYPLVPASPPQLVAENEV